MDYRPADHLRGTSQTSACQPNLLILNQPIADFDVFERLWRSTKYRICADGGANRLYNMFEAKSEGRRAEYLPDVIHGDLDSLREDVHAYYASKDVAVNRDPDQYSTDFGKTLKLIIANHDDSHGPWIDVIVLGTLAGRVDQGLGVLHEMYREQKNNKALRLWLFSESNITFLLKPGTSSISTTLSEGYLTKYVGIIPLYGPAIITTSGLEWDVTDWPTSMSTQVSTSNHVMADDTIITTNVEVLFTIEHAKKLPATDEPRC